MNDHRKKQNKGYLIILGIIRILESLSLLSCVAIVIFLWYLGYRDNLNEARLLVDHFFWWLLAFVLGLAGGSRFFSNFVKNIQE